MDSKTEIAMRSQYVVKSNALIQSARYSLSVQELKVLTYLISNIRMDDDKLCEQEFEMQDFCLVCGIDCSNGKNYKNLRRTVKALHDKSFYIPIGERAETLVCWIERPTLYHRSGKIKIKLDDYLAPFLLHLQKNFTEYQLQYVLRMSSKYGIRLYEYVKSVHYDESEPYEFVLSLDKLREVMDAETYTQFRDLKRRVLVAGVDDINEFTDKKVMFEPIKTGRAVTDIRFTVSTKDAADLITTRTKLFMAYNNIQPGKHK